MANDMYLNVDTLVAVRFALAPQQQRILGRSFLGRFVVLVLWKIDDIRMNKTFVLQKQRSKTVAAI